MLKKFTTYLSFLLFFSTTYSVYANEACKKRGFEYEEINQRINLEVLTSEEKNRYNCKLELTKGGGYYSHTIGEFISEYTKFDYKCSNGSKLYFYLYTKENGITKYHTYIDKNGNEYDLDRLSYNKDEKYRKKCKEKITTGRYEYRFKRPDLKNNIRLYIEYFTKYQGNQGSYPSL